MSDFYRNLKKAELHLHLEGSIAPATIHEMHPHISIKEVENRYDHADFIGFLDAYKWIVQFLQTPEQYALATRRLLEGLEKQNVRYVELTLSVGVILWKKQDLAAIYTAINREAKRSRIPCFWIFDFIRHFDLGHAMRVAELAAEHVNDGVVGFGLGGDESRGRAITYLPAFELARKAGLHLVPHGGETTSAQAVWDALKVGGERIGHGIRAVEDPELLAELRRQNIPLEICISSNVATGAVRDLQSHPLRRIADAGVPIILNTDDPAIFETTLAAEYEKAEQLGFSQSELVDLAANGFRYALHPKFRTTE